MSVFDLNPFEVGNPMTLGMFEDLLTLDIHRMQQDSQYWEITMADVNRMLDWYDVEYSDLPYHIKREIDKINIV